MKRYEVEIESRISVKIDANSKEEASMVAMENSEFGERLLENAIVSDVEELEELSSSKSKNEGIMDIHKKTYWKIFGVAIVLGVLTAVAAYYDNSWVGLPLGIITIILFLLLRTCNIIRTNRRNRHEK